MTLFMQQCVVLQEGNTFYLHLEQYQNSFASNSFTELKFYS